MHYGLIKVLQHNDNSCLVLGVLSDSPISETANQLPEDHVRIINKMTKKLNNPGDMLWQSEMGDQSLLLINCGKKSEFNRSVMQKRLADVLNQLMKQHFPAATICLPKIEEMTANEQLEHMILQADQQLYQLLDFKTEKAKPHALQTIQFYLPDAEEGSMKEPMAIAEGVRLTRNLANMPANVCTPSWLAEQAIELQTQHPKISTHVFSADEMKHMGMNSFLAVAQGSTQPPKLIELQYNGKHTNLPSIVLVGKGITFDSGGISIKPAQGMEEMKFDMAGAASVLGTLKACALLDLPLRVTGLLACAENLPSGTAIKPGDIVTSMSGQTIEIINTDAEGRLVLADALTYAERFNPDFVIDIATLTGAIIIALGHEYTGLMTQDDALAELILSASAKSADKVWRMPLEESYETGLESVLADIANITGDRAAGSVTAACFLSRFTKKYRWAHLDIAGTAWTPGKKCNASGRPVSLLTRILRDAANTR